MTHLPETIAADIAALECDILARRVAKCREELDELAAQGEDPRSHRVLYWQRQLESAIRTAHARGVKL